PNPDFVPPNLVRISGLEPLEDRFHLGLRLLARHARLKPREYGVVVTLSHAGRIDAHRDEHVQLPVAVPEILRRHADNRVRIAVDRNALARDRRVDAEAPPPQSVAQNRDALAVRRILLLREAAPDGRIHAEDAEEIRADSGAPDELGLAPARKIDAGADPDRSGDAVERPAMLAPEDELRFARVPETRVGPIRGE